MVGMLKNSSLYNPLRRPELVRERRNIVYQAFHIAYQRMEARNCFEHLY